MKAYCYASGEVEFIPSSKKVPEGAICFAEGKGQPFIESIKARCRLAYPQFIDGVRQPDTWLIPGIPEAENQQQAMDALKRFESWLQKGAELEIDYLEIASRLPDHLQPVQLIEITPTKN